MDNQTEARGLAIRRAAIVIAALTIVGSFIWLAFFRHKPQTTGLRDGQTTTSNTNAQPKSSGTGQSTAPSTNGNVASGASTQPQPTATAGKTQPTSSPGKLVDTGPGNTVFIISAASTVIGTGIHMAYSKRRTRLQRAVYQRITD